MADSEDVKNTGLYYYPEISLFPAIQLAWTIHETPARPGLILSPTPFSVVDSVSERNAARRNTDCISDGDAQSEQDSLQEKGVRKNLVAS